MQLRSHCLVPVVVLVGCGPSAAKIQAWKSDPEGAAKLVGVVKDDGAPPALRGQAAAALVEAGQGHEMEAAVAGLDIEARTALAPAAVSGLTPLLASGQGDRPGEARSALYVLREQTGAGDVRARIDAVLFPALVADVRAGRPRAGRLSVQDMLIGIGTPILPRLVPLLEEPAVPFDTLVEVIDKVADAQTKDRAGAALVARAKQLQALPEPLFPALARMGGQVAADFLMSVVERPNAVDAERAAVALGKLGRAKGVASFAARLAGNPTTAAPLREQLFVVTEQIRTEESRQALSELIRSSLDPATRYRAFRALLKSAGGGGLLAGLEAFPARAKYSAEDVRRELVEPISAMAGFDTRPPLFKALESPAPLARLVALLAIEKMGFESDAQHAAKLEKDQGVVQGLPPSDRVGRQATRIAAALRAKKS